MEKLTVKNFGPIKDIAIDVKDINIFIGPTSSGKSTVAKLIAIFINADPESGFIYSDSRTNELEKFKKHLVDYNIDFEVKDNTEIVYIAHDLTVQIKNKKFSCIFSSNENGVSIYDAYWPVYIPAERMLIPNVGEKNNVSLSESLEEFGSMFDFSRKNLNSFDMPFIQAKYEYSDRNNFLVLPGGVKIRLEEASSGFQSLVPLMLVMENYAGYNRPSGNCYIIEEPELNLYPSMQQPLIEFILHKVNDVKVNQSINKLIITTHSPYTLTAIDNLIQAKNTYNKHNELKDEINKIVPENLWIDFDRVSCYYFEDGYCRSTMDNEMQSIGPSNIDDVSESLGATFDRLLELKYQA